MIYSNYIISIKKTTYWIWYHW